ncbi:LOW QUALITY PROTEIN: A-kinase anchor protein 10, mitochondrial [Maniola hyperantus]|uniref:LOW QUALITY PROTEIN: A-kinase anchor protein 10, mitochondrial n=1 Tax=Aphantopus hyperantus TaxID=2795564 RepID=UPI001568FFCE|nr:LOW QUALITY PROTEIN: A-kinase anchor protein 10, mitochondrial [Maniola hyperantus]
MIKFWKSAAKGKTGCPVRPPEGIENRQIKLDIEGSNDVDDKSDIFEKKSKLSISLHDILIGKTAVKYFTMYMENIGKQYLIKCWMELENFRFQLSGENNKHKETTHSKISYTKSFDDEPNNIQQNCENFMIKKFGWRASTSNLRKANSKCSVNSCGNLFQHLDNNCDCCDDKKNITEKAIDLFKKYVALEAPYQIDLSDDLRKTVISDICQPEGQITGDCFKPVQDILYDQIDKNYFLGFQNSPLYIKSQIDILTGGCINLKDILYNDTILFYFTEFLEQESCSNLLEFLISIMNYRDNMIRGNTPNLQQAQGDAIVLYDKYFSLQATNPIGFPTEIRLKVESDICSEPIATCFDTPYIIVYRTLSNYVKTFLGSELYYNYLSEMIKSVDQRWSPNCKSHSDCSSEFSISTQNTLLATGDPQFRKKRNYSVPDMTIDSNQLYNADALWQRKKHDGLSLGRINSLGRFESKFEPDPDKKERSMLKKMVSKFVATNTSKVEEEMAWQIAHMIVKDVTDLTMAPPENDNV